MILDFIHSHDQPFPTPSAVARTLAQFNLRISRDAEWIDVMPQYIKIAAGAAILNQKQYAPPIEEVVKGFYRNEIHQDILITYGTQYDNVVVNGSDWRRTQDALTQAVKPSLLNFVLYTVEHWPLSIG